MEKDDYEDDPPARTGMGGMGAARAAVAVASGEDTATAPSSGRGGLGSMKRGGKGGIGSSSRAGLGSSEASRPPLESSDSLKGGLGSARDPALAMDDASATAPMPTPGAFGRKALDPESEAGPSDYGRSQQSFRGRTDTPPINVKKAELTAHEKAHFSQIDKSYGVAAKWLSSMGWSAGEGLGKDRSGRAVPVEAGRVMRGQGISSGIRTEGSKRDARRRGEVISDDEDEKPRRRGKALGKGGMRGMIVNQEETEAEQSWKRQKKVKVKVEHKTYEQLLAEAGEKSHHGVGQIIDARGGDVSASSHIF